MGPGRGRDLSGYAWLGVFVPSLAYFALTRTVLAPPRAGGGGGGGGLLGQTYDFVSDRLVVADGGGARAEALGRVFRIVPSAAASSSSASPGGGGGDVGLLRLAHPLESVVSGPPLASLSSLLWAHDPELGRGYLLASDSGRSGRIWRWEVGGGPITIGRSLHMEGSGCRSGIWTQCPPNDIPPGGDGRDGDGRDGDGDDDAGTAHAGSSGLAVEIAKDAESHRTGRLVVREMGERRIARVEEDGARTPLVVSAPSLCKGTAAAMAAADKEERLSLRGGSGGTMIYTHFGDLIFAENVDCPLAEAETAEAGGPKRRGGVYRLREAVHVPPVPSRLSRAAHGWNSTRRSDEGEGEGEGSPNVELLFANLDRVSDLALGIDLDALYVSGIAEGGRAVVMKLPLDSDEDAEAEAETEAGGGRDGGIKGLLDEKAVPFCDVTSTSVGSSTPDPGWNGPALTVDAAGNLYAATPSGVSVVNASGDILGTLSLAGLIGDEAPTAMELGEDGYLYVATSGRIMRVRVKAKPAKLPTDMVVPPRKRRAGTENTAGT